jgi:hypothetical protein
MTNEAKVKRERGICKCGAQLRYKQRNCKACHAATMRQYRRVNPMTPMQREKDKIRSLAKHYYQTGRIVKTQCELCGDPNSEMHHPDYNKPLMVVWLCRPHHLNVHAGIITLLEHPYPVRQCIVKEAKAA